MSTTALAAPTSEATAPTSPYVRRRASPSMVRWPVVTVLVVMPATLGTSGLPRASEETLNSHHSLLHSVRVQGGGARRAGARALPPRRRRRRARSRASRRPTRRAAAATSPRWPTRPPSSVSGTAAASPGACTSSAWTRWRGSARATRCARPASAPSSWPPATPSARPSRSTCRPRAMTPRQPSCVSRPGTPPASPSTTCPSASPSRTRRVEPRPTDGHRRVRRVGTPMADGCLRRAGRPSST